MSIQSIDEFHSIYSDMYKDAHGFRPGPNAFRCETLEEAQREFDYLQRTINNSINEEAAVQRKALVDFEAHMVKQMALLGKDRRTIIRWEMDAEGLDFNEPQDVELFYYNRDLPMQAIREFAKRDHGFGVMW